MPEPYNKRVIEWMTAGFISGAAYGSIISVWNSPKIPVDVIPSLSQQAKLIGKHSLQLAAVGALYVTGEAAAESIRKKDDCINAAVGGACAGSLAGIKYNSIARGFRGAGVLAIASAFINYMYTGTESPGEKWEKSRAKYIQ